jgi:predicted DNA-binding transcriptional regulator YafY
MDDQAKFERMLRMLLLLASGRKYSIRELADRFEISDRTIKRYIATFRAAGFLVECHSGQYFLQKLAKPFRELSDLLHFSEEEALVLMKAIHAIEDNNLLKSNLRKKLYALYDTDRLVDVVVKPEQSEIIHTLIKAIKEKKQVVLRQYRSSNGNIVRDRLVEPHGITGNYQFIWAFEPESQTNKLFKITRMQSASMLEKPFVSTEFHHSEPMDVFRISSGIRNRVLIQLNTRAYNLLLEEYPLAEAFTRKVDDNFWHLETEVRGFEGVGRFCLGLPGEAKVLEPKELKSYLRSQALVFM